MIRDEENSSDEQDLEKLLSSAIDRAVGKDSVCNGHQRVPNCVHTLEDDFFPGRVCQSKSKRSLTQNPRELGSGRVNSQSGRAVERWVGFDEERSEGLTMD